MNDPTQDPSDRKDSTFVIITAALVTLVIVLLGVLTLRMRTRAIRAERRVVALTKQVSPLRGSADAIALLERAVREQYVYTPVDRSKLPRQTVRLDGRERTALRLQADVAEQIGLAPGDVVLVDRTPATASAPATAPGTRE